MKNLIVLLVFNFLFVSILSCQEGKDKKKADLIGTWQYSRSIDSEKDIEISLEGREGNTKSRKIIEQYKREGVEHFYLVFEKIGKLVEYKLGLGMKFD